MSYTIFGRAIKNEYLALGTLIGTTVIAMSATGGSKGDAKPKTVEQAKETVKFNAGSSEEEQFIKNFIAEEEKKASHH